jgi:hypothetical protein
VAGVRRIGDTLEWNIRPGNQNIRSNYRLQVTSTHTAEIKYASASAELFLNEKLLYHISSVVRLVTGLDGKLLNVAGIVSEKTKVKLHHVSGHEQQFSIEPNTIMTL